MNVPPFRIKPFGPRALLLEWPAEVREDILKDILSFSDYLRKSCLEGDEWELIPVYHSLALIRSGHDIEIEVLSRSLREWYAGSPGPMDVVTNEWELPVCYEKEFAPDLEVTAGKLGMSVDEVIRLHCSVAYRVYGIGFLPGFLYLGGVPPELQLPRREVPRLHVPRGAVGLAAKQTGIYPQDSPGGWNLIGNCPIPLFDPKRENPCFIALGDTVRFIAVSEAEYNLHRIEAEVGVYDFKKKYGNAKG